jgi:CheY-like chemotaxis protein
MDATAALVSTTPASSLLFVDEEPAGLRYLPALSRTYHVTLATTTANALREVQRTQPGLVVTELVLPDGTGTAICRAAKTLPHTPRVLVTTDDVDRVPDALDAGCDAVLLKPFAPNLLITRLGRLSRSAVPAREPQTHARRRMARPEGLRDRTPLLLHSTNNHWPHTHCPYCSHQGVTSFEFLSRRRAWYACLACRKVWIAPRQDTMDA